MLERTMRLCVCEIHGTARHTRFVYLDVSRAANCCIAGRGRTAQVPPLRVESLLSAGEIVKHNSGVCAWPATSFRDYYNASALILVSRWNL